MTMPAPTMNDDGLKNSMIASAILHVVALLFLYFGLPHLMPPPPEQHDVLPFEIVELADVSTTVKPPEPQPEQPKPPPPEPPKPQPKPEPSVTPPPPAPPQPQAQQPAPAEALKPVPVPKEKPKPPEAKPQQDDFSKLLKNLEANKKPDTPKTEAKPDSKAPVAEAAKPAPPLSMMELRTLQDAIISQISPCWNPPIGARDIQTLAVELSINLNPDGSVVDVDIVDKGRYNTDSYFRAAADTASRTVRNPRCSPLKLPADKYPNWKHIDFNFDPRDMQ